MGAQELQHTRPPEQSGGQLGSRAYHRMWASRTPAAGSVSAAKVDSARSRMRPSMYGPRSSTTQLVLRPLDKSVTVTTVPLAMVRLAHVPGVMAYQDTAPVCWWADDILRTEAEWRAL